LQNRLTY